MNSLTEVPPLTKQCQHLRHIQSSTICWRTHYQNTYKAHFSSSWIKTLKCSNCSQSQSIISGFLTFIRTDSESFSLLTILMATFCPVIQWRPSLTSPEGQHRETQRGKRKTFWVSEVIVQRENRKEAESLIIQKALQTLSQTHRLKLAPWKDWLESVLGDPSGRPLPSPIQNTLQL